AMARSARSSPALLLRVDLHLVAVLHAALRSVRAGDDLVGGLEARQHLEIFVARNAHLDRHELDAAAPDDEYAFGFLARLPRFELGGSRDGFYTTARSLLIARLLHHLTIGVIDQLPHSNRGNRHRCDVLADRGC